MTQSSWNQNSYLNIKLGEQFSLKVFIFSTILLKLYLVKVCPIFTGSASNCLTSYKQILSGCTLGCKNALTFTCLPMKFHNHVHPNAQLGLVAGKWNQSQHFVQIFEKILIWGHLLCELVFKVRSKLMTIIIYNHNIQITIISALHWVLPY